MALLSRTIKAWCIFRDCAGVLLSRAQIKISDVEAIEARALMIRRDEVFSQLPNASQVSSTKAAAIVSFFTCDLKKYECFIH